MFWFMNLSDIVTSNVFFSRDVKDRKMGFV